MRPVKDFLRAVSNLHRQGSKGNIFLFANPRGGSTWVMEILASQPGMKHYDEPFNIRRENVARAGVFTDWCQLMPETGDPDRVIRYLERITGNDFRFMNPSPFRPHHRFFTSRIVFKIHELGHLASEIRRRLGGHVLYLLRHPVPTSRSRKVFPRLGLFVDSDAFLGRYLDARQIAEIRRIARSGSHVERGTVSWCCENLAALNDPDLPNWLVLTYEELVLNPGRACRLMLERLDLDDLNELRRAAGEPSSNIAMSSDETRRILDEPDDLRRKAGLVMKWAGKIAAEEEQRVEEIQRLFGLDVYRRRSFISTPRYLHFDDTATILGEAAAVADQAHEA